MLARYTTGGAEAEYHSSVELCSRQINFEATNLTVTFYWNDLNPNYLEYQLKAFEPNFESDKMPDEITLSDITTVTFSCIMMPQLERKWFGEVLKLCSACYKFYK